MEFKAGDTVIPVISDQEQTPPQELVKIHTEDSETLYELSDGKSYPALVPGNRLTWALVTLRHGYSVIPVQGKKPVIAWKKYQSQRLTENELKSCWQKSANLAVICGEISGIIVLDIDSPEGEKYAKEHGLPETPTVITGKGKHYYFKHPGYKVGNFARKVDGLDLRGDGGYVVAPESWHAEKQKTYRWTKAPWDVPLADAPLWLLELLEEKKEKNHQVGQNGYAEAAFSDELSILARAQDGERNDQLNKSAFSLGQLVAAGVLEENQVRTSLFAVATAIGLSEKESRQTIESGIEDGKRQPRDIPEGNYSDSLPPLPEITDDLLEQKYQELKNANEKEQPQRFTEMIDLLTGADPFTVEAYVNKLATDKIASKTLTRNAIKQNAQQKKAQTKQQQRPNPTHDELGDRWIAQHGELTIFIYDKWYRYHNGIWHPTEVVEAEVWDVLVGAKSEGVRPTRNTKTSVIDYMQNQCRKGDETMNSDPSLIALQNGVFDLKNFELIDYDPVHYMTSKLSFGYSPKAECPLWEETILDWLSFNEIGVKHLQEAVGYSLTGSVKYQMAWMLAGAF